MDIFLDNTIGRLYIGADGLNYLALVEDWSGSIEIRSVTSQE